MENELLATCLLAGRIMIEGGSEMYRVDDTMSRIARNGGAGRALVFTTPTGLFIAVNGEPPVELEPVQKRGIDMEKVAGVNQLSREFQAGRLTLTELRLKLEQLDTNTPYFPVWLQILAAAVCSTTLMVIFAQQYDWFDMPLSAVVGALGFAAYLRLSSLTRVRFISELIGAVVVGVSAWVGVRLGVGHNLDNVIIGAVMPLVPGVAITNSIRDMLAGHLLSGMARGMEAILSACAIGVGIAMIFRFF
ncbi:threonine/serine exporter family protein [Lacticaseibacillus parakribbianus]|uniref:threonine/serine exporter family protein n=1 Tax=Lacticaseibacillus parakribbianus TaxID=2970927 RepID=UPI0021CB5918|nr:threonine/serine exporter family protein [Lacticaseibacillus parakribbianus]